MNEIKGVQWNYQPCVAERRLVRVLPGDGPFKWWQPYVGKVMQALKVTTRNEDGGVTFYLYDGDGSATNKVTQGGGPNMNHDSFEFCEELPAGELAVVTTRLPPCEEHDWEEEELPIFSHSKSRRCRVCAASEVVERMMKSQGKRWR